MQLLPPELRTQLPKLFAQEGTKDPMVHLKFFTPWSGWTRYVTEGQADDDDFRFFGYVIGLAKEWGYFLLSELESVHGPAGLCIERDVYFRSQPFSRIQR